MRERVESSKKPLKGLIGHADFFPWETENGKFVLCVTGFLGGEVRMNNQIRTSWVEKAYSRDGKRFVETRNSIYEVVMNDAIWKTLHDQLKHENLDVERMKL